VDRVGSTCSEMSAPASTHHLARAGVTGVTRPETRLKASQQPRGGPDLHDINRAGWFRIRARVRGVKKPGVNFYKMDRSPSSSPTVNCDLAGIRTLL